MSKYVKEKIETGYLITIQEDTEIDEIYIFAGDRLWVTDDMVIHRDGNEPALIRKDGTRVWLKHGKLHRDGLPAVLYPDGDYEYWYDDKKHNLDGPATMTYGNEDYYINGRNLSEDEWEKEVDKLKYERMFNG